MSSGGLPSGRSCTATAPRCLRARFKRRTRAAVPTSSVCSITRRHWRAGSSWLISDTTSGRDRGVAARHRETCRAGAHSVQTRPADAGRAEEDADARADRRRDCQRGAVSLARSLRSFAVITSAGTERVIRPDYAGNRFRSEPEYCLSSTASTRSRPSARTGPAVSPDAAIRLLKARPARHSIPPSSRDSPSCCRC